MSYNAGRTRGSGIGLDAPSTAGGSSARVGQRPPPQRRFNNALGDDDSDDHDDRTADHTQAQRHELVSFGRDGAVKRKRSPPPVGPRVIPMTANLDWRQDRKKRLGLEDKARSMGSLSSIRAADQTNGQHKSQLSSVAPERINDQAQKRGLEVRAKSGVEGASAGHDDAMDSDRFSNRSGTPPADQVRSGTPPPETAEQAAIRALLAGEAVGSSSAQKLDLIISQSNEKELFQSDVDTRPDAPSLEDYAATPIDQFGAALLRGMGWKEGKGAGKNGQGPQVAPEPKKRAALLGLGAKERPVDPTLKTSTSRRRGPPARPERRYVPVTREGSSLSSAKEESGGHRPRDRDHGETSLRQRSNRSASPSEREEERRHRSSRDSRQDESGRSHRERERDRNRDRDRDRNRDRDRPGDDYRESHQGERDHRRRGDRDGSSRPDRGHSRPESRRYDDDRRRDYRQSEVKDREDRERDRRR